MNAKLIAHTAGGNSSCCVGVTTAGAVVTCSVTTAGMGCLASVCAQHDPDVAMSTRSDHRVDNSTIYLTPRSTGELASSDRVCDSCYVIVRIWNMAA